MKWTLVGVAMAAMNLNAESPAPKVAVCLEYKSAQLDDAYKARFVASRIYTQIGVELEWLLCGKGRDEDIRIRVVAEAPDGFQPGALAHALPYEGKTIEVFYNRIRRNAPGHRGDLLGHVLAHEIAHALQGIARHSVDGVLKATFTERDKYEMSARPLRFTPHDAALIHGGIRVRAERRAFALSGSNRLP